MMILNEKAALSAAFFIICIFLALLATDLRGSRTKSYPENVKFWKMGDICPCKSSYYACRKTYGPCSLALGLKDCFK